MSVIQKGWRQGNKPIDPYLNTSKSFPATCIAQGTADTIVPLEAPRSFVDNLQNCGVRSQIIEIPGAEHMFTATMKPGDRTYELQRQGFDFVQEVFVSVSKV